MQINISKDRCIFEHQEFPAIFCAVLLWYLFKYIMSSIPIHEYVLLIKENNLMLNLALEYVYTKFWYAWKMNFEIIYFFYSIS